MVLQSFTSFFYIIIPSSSEEEREKERGEKKITHGKMQMSLEAITMLMRFHHRSCCSGIRGIFHPYLENNRVLKTGDTLPSVHSQLPLQLESGPSCIGGGFTVNSRAQRFIYWQSDHRVALWGSALFLALLLSITSKNPLVNITIKLFLSASKYHKQICMLAHVLLSDECDC